MVLPYLSRDEDGSKEIEETICEGEGFEGDVRLAGTLMKKLNDYNMAEDDEKDEFKNLMRLMIR